ncbi:hypothetical protein F5X68DRAFT_227127 [Plectosphaerella plurivora]|uniref:Uncharacterized protein n=1 Tax=Plectosphaerella plurivora TaxID=936078 RepID=A0A9P8VIH1_9PEZI|nr:hypothetical protein F5X68DRAFT_227127 [Plectosphaerella plurivora]
MTAYTSAVSSMLQMVSNSSMDHDRLVEQIVTFERQVTTLGDSMVNSDHIAEKFNNQSGYGQQIALDKYLQAQFPANYLPDDVLLCSPSYFKRVSELIEKTDRETVQGHLMWFATYTLMSRVAPDFSLPLRRLRNVMIGVKPENTMERWKYCMNQLATDMRWSYGRGFLQQAFPVESKTLGDRMIEEFKDVYRERLRKIGYPTSNPDLGDAKSVNDWYHGLNISSDTYFKNSVDLAIADMNTYHAYDQNAIVFPAGFMQSPLFGLGYPDHINYGAWGMLASHEIIHGFDNLGYHLDETSTRVDWWDNATSVEFEQRGQCFVDQFDQYQIVGADGQLKNVNGTRTQNEAIADAGGLATSFRAWQQRKAQAPSKKLPGLEGFTAEQLFFISFGHIWCSKMQPAKLEQMIGDSHPPHRARLLYTTANSRGFLEAFNCLTKEPVCELW